MLLSVIVPSHNIERYLGRCLSSLRQQDLRHDEYEVIVIDDGSTDESWRVAREHASKDPRITVHRQSNQGPSAARNAGLDLARGRFIYFVDGDDYVAPDSLRRVVETMSDHRLEACRVDTRRVRPDESAEPSQGAAEHSEPLEVVTGIDYMASHHFPVTVWSYLFERAFLERSDIRFEVGRLIEDGVYTACVLALVRRMAPLPADVYRYVLRPGSIMRDPSTEQARRLVADFEWVVLGLEQLRERTVADGTATPGFLDRLMLRQEGYVFFLLGRLIRSQVPLRGTLPALLSRLRAGGFYPLTMFPADDYPGAQYRILTTIFNRRYLLYPFGYGYRALAAVGRLLPRPRVR